MPPKKKAVKKTSKETQTQKQEQKIVVNIGKQTTHKKKNTNKPKQPKQQKVNNPLVAPIVINTMPQLPPPPQPLAFAPTNNPLYYSTTPQLQPQPQPEVRPIVPQPVQNPVPVPRGRPIRPPPPVRNPPPVARQSPQPQVVPEVTRNPPPVAQGQPLQPPPVRNQPDIQVPILPPRRQPQQQPEVIRNPPPVAQGQPIAPPESRFEAPPTTRILDFNTFPIDAISPVPDDVPQPSKLNTPIKKARKPSKVDSSTQANIPKPLPPNVSQYLSRYAELRPKLVSGNFSYASITKGERDEVRDIASRLNIPVDDRIRFKTIDDEIQRKLLKRL